MTNVLTRRIGILLILLGSTVSCQSLNPSQVTKGASPDIENQEKFAKVDLIASLDPFQFGPQVKSGTTRPNRGSTTPGDDSAPGWDLVEDAFAGFYDTRYTESTSVRRNRVQDRLLNASELNCDDFKKDIHRFKGDLDFVTKSFSIALSTAGAIVSGNASQILSGAAGGVTGVGTAADEAYLNALTLGVIVKGIDTRRTEKLLEIRQRQLEDIGGYTVEAAVHDALEYHNSCSVLAGIDEADNTVSESKEQAKNRLEILRTQTYGFDASSARVQAFLGWDGTAYSNSVNLKRFDDWKVTNGISTISSTLIINGAGFSNARRKAIKDLSIP